MQASNKHNLPYTQVNRGGQLVLPYVASGKAAAVLVSLMRFLGHRAGRRVSMPRTLIAEDTGLTERQVKSAIRSLKRTTVPDPDTGEAVSLLEVLAEGHNGTATVYRLNVSNVDAVPWGYEVAAYGGVGAEPDTPTGARVGVGAEPDTPTGARNGVGAEIDAEGVPTDAEGVPTGHGRGAVWYPLIDKEINKKIREGWKGENGEWDGDRLFRAECPECGRTHAFILNGPEFGTGKCLSTGGEVTAPPPDGYRVTAQGGTYVLEWLGDGRA